MPLLFAFHEPWEEDETEASSKAFTLWGGLILAGLSLGLLIYIALVPMGGAAWMIRSTETANSTPAADSSLSIAADSTPSASPTICPSPEAPASTVAAFLGAISRQDFEAAWQLTSSPHQQRSYNGSFSQFAANWEAWGSLTQKQTTLSVPSERQAAALVQISYSNQANRQAELTMDLTYDASLCRWQIVDIRPLTPPTD